MSSYVKATNFATKDTLPSGDANKIVKGTELDNEFNAIAGAISSKADLASPALTGAPTTPTAAAGTNTTQIASTAFVTTAVSTATGALGTMSTQNASSVAITGGTVSGITGSINSVTPGSNSVGARTVSTGNPSGGSNGDIWYKV